MSQPQGAPTANEPVARLWSVRQDADLGLHSSGLRLSAVLDGFQLDQLHIWRSGDRHRQILAKDDSPDSATRLFERTRLQRLIAGAAPDSQLNPLIVELLGQPFSAQDVIVRLDPPQPALLSERIFAAVSRAPAQVPLVDWPEGERLLLSMGPSWIEALSYGHPASTELAATARQRAVEALRYALHVRADTPRPTALIDAVWSGTELWLLDLLGLEGADMRDGQPYIYRRRLLEQLISEELHVDRGAIAVLSAADMSSASLLIDGDAAYGRGLIRRSTASEA